jgi:iron complex outermembrane receptor protein
MMNKHVWGVALAALGSVQPALAQDGAQDGAEDSPVIVTGTRTTGLRAIDSPAPVQVLDAETLERTGSPSLMGALSTTLASFNSQAVGNDLANETLAARLRGISPNHTLILINGKRRHGTANLSVLSSAFQGGAAPTSTSSPPPQSAGWKCCSTARPPNMDRTRSPGWSTSGCATRPRAGG